jgi:PadR family transcriptional regulator PadR
LTDKESLAIILLVRLGEEFMDKSTELLPGMLDMLILKAVSLGPLHGYGVLLRIHQISRRVLNFTQGSLYPALYRLEHQGLIASDWGESENKRKEKFYRLTADGRKRLREEAAGWNRLVSAISAVMDTTPEEV